MISAFVKHNFDSWNNLFRRSRLGNNDLLLFYIEKLFKAEERILDLKFEKETFDL